MFRRCALAAAMSLVVSPQVLGQSVAAVEAPAQQTVAVLTAPAQQNVLRAGAEVPLVMREELTTEKKKLRVGQRFQMAVAANVESGGLVVIPSGTPAVGEVTEVRNKGMWGKSGYINARVISLRLGDRNVRLTGTFDDKGVTGTAGVVGAIALVPIAGFFMTGTSAKIPMGSGVKGFLDEDLAFRAVPAKPRVIDVPIAAAPRPAPEQPAENSAAEASNP